MLHGVHKMIRFFVFAHIWCNVNGPRQEHFDLIVRVIVIFFIIANNRLVALKNRRHLVVDVLGQKLDLFELVAIFGWHDGGS